MEGICKPATQPQTPFGEEEVWFSNASTAKGLYSPPDHGYLNKLQQSTPYKTLTFKAW